LKLFSLGRKDCSGNTLAVRWVFGVWQRVAGQHDSDNSGYTCRNPVVESNMDILKMILLDFEVVNYTDAHDHLPKWMNGTQRMNETFSERNLATA